MRTKIIVFDEATAMLDPAGRREILETVQRLHAQGLTIIYITHFMEEAAVADKIFLMEEGKILKIGTPRQIFSDVNEIKRLGLDVPVAVEISERLRRRGLKFPKNILTDEDFVNACL